MTRLQYLGALAVLGVAGLVGGMIGGRSTGHPAYGQEIAPGMPVPEEIAPEAPMPEEIAPVVPVPEFVEAKAFHVVDDEGDLRVRIQVQPGPQSVGAIHQIDPRTTVIAEL
ncbi:MAG TPA: hypothetical protein QGH10_24745 [Armatimonadota bacterium]|nr:hypothetical protein [Armatimonadota bacterium]